MPDDAALCCQRNSMSNIIDAQTTQMNGRGKKKDSIPSTWEYCSFGGFLVFVCKVISDARIDWSPFLFPYASL